MTQILLFQSKKSPSATSDAVKIARLSLFLRFSFSFSLEFGLHGVENLRIQIHIHSNQKCLNFWFWFWFRNLLHRVSNVFYMRSLKYDYFDFQASSLRCYSCTESRNQNCDDENEMEIKVWSKFCRFLVENSHRMKIMNWFSLGVWNDYWVWCERKGCLFESCKRKWDIKPNSSQLRWHEICFV